MKQQLESIITKVRADLAQIADKAQLEQLRIRYLGRKGELTAILAQMGSLSPEERPVVGALANTVRGEIETAIAQRAEVFEQEALSAALQSEKIDVTMPGAPRRIGRKHPMTITVDEVKELFLGMGFTIAEGPEIETTYYNFTALNTAENHPSRDMQDTFYVTEDIVLRTQTSPVQVRVMEQMKPPIKVISPGRVYRKDEVDATHSPMFHQVEGLVVDKGVTMADLKGTLAELVRGIYGPDSRVRFRPHHFPFTEPSCEVDVMCFSCHGAGCRICKGEGWIELLGAGMVHPNVLSGCGIDPEVYSGFAFGIGLDRMTMRRFQVDDLRLFFENDVRFLHQF